MRRKLKQRAIKFYVPHPCCHKMWHYKNYLFIINDRKGFYLKLAAGGARWIIKFLHLGAGAEKINMPSTFPFLSSCTRRGLGELVGAKVGPLLK